MHVHACGGLATSMRALSRREWQGQTLRPSRHMHARANTPGLRNRRVGGASPPAGLWSAAALLLSASASLASSRIRCCSRPGLAGALLH